MVFNLGKRTLAGKATLLGTLRPLTLFGSGVPAASTFYKSLADADDAALKRLFISALHWTSFRGCLFFVSLYLTHENAIFMDRTTSCNQ